MKEIFIEKLKSIDSLEQYEFILSSNRYPTLKKIEGERILTLGTGDLFELKMHSIGCHLIFTPIEKYIQDIDEDWRADWKPTIKQFNHTSLTGKIFGKDIYEFMPIQINTEENIDKGIKLLNQFIDQDMNPFFKYWDKITKLIPYLEVEYDDFGSMNKVFMQDSVLKKSILWFLTDHPEKGNFVNHHINRLNQILKENTNNKLVKKGLRKLVNLKEILEKESPKYLWNPEYTKTKYDG